MKTKIASLHNPNLIQELEDPEILFKFASTDDIHYFGDDFIITRTTEKLDDIDADKYGYPIISDWIKQQLPDGIRYLNHTETSITYGIKNEIYITYENPRMDTLKETVTIYSSKWNDILIKLSSEKGVYEEQIAPIPEITNSLDHVPTLDGTSYKIEESPDRKIEFKEPDKNVSLTLLEDQLKLTLPKDVKYPFTFDPTIVVVAVGSIGYDGISTIVVNATTNRMVVGYVRSGRSYVSYSDDYGATWTEVASPRLNPLRPDSSSAVSVCCYGDHFKLLTKANYGSGFHSWNGYWYIDFFADATFEAVWTRTPYYRVTMFNGGQSFNGGVDSATGKQLWAGNQEYDNYLYMEDVGYWNLGNNYEGTTTYVDENDDLWVLYVGYASRRYSRIYSRRYHYGSSAILESLTHVVRSDFRVSMNGHITADNNNNIWATWIDRTYTYPIYNVMVQKRTGVSTWDAIVQVTDDLVNTIYGPNIMVNDAGKLHLFMYAIGYGAYPTKKQILHREYDIATDTWTPLLSADPEIIDEADENKRQPRGITKVPAGVVPLEGFAFVMYNEDTADIEFYASDDVEWPVVGGNPGQMILPIY